MHEADVGITSGDHNITYSLSSAEVTCNDLNTYCSAVSLQSIFWPQFWKGSVISSGVASLRHNAWSSVNNIQNWGCGSVTDMLRAVNSCHLLLYNMWQNEAISQTRQQLIALVELMQAFYWGSYTYSLCSAQISFCILCFFCCSVTLPLIIWVQTWINENCSITVGVIALLEVTQSLDWCSNSYSLNSAHVSCFILLCCWWTVLLPGFIWEQTCNYEK